MQSSNELFSLSEITEDREIRGTKRGTIKAEGTERARLWKDRKRDKHEETGGNDVMLASVKCFQRHRLEKKDWLTTDREQNDKRKKRTERWGQRKRETSINDYNPLFYNVEQWTGATNNIGQSESGVTCLPLFLSNKTMSISSLLEHMGHPDSKILVWLKEIVEKNVRFGPLCGPRYQQPLAEFHTCSIHISLTPVQAPLSGNNFLLYIRNVRIRSPRDWLYLCSREEQHHPQDKMAILYAR